MNDDRQMAAESQYNFHILPHFNSKITEPIITNFLDDVQALVPLLMVSKFAEQAKLES